MTTLLTNESQQQKKKKKKLLISTDDTDADVMIAVEVEEEEQQQLLSLRNIVATKLNNQTMESAVRHLLLRRVIQHTTHITPPCCCCCCHCSLSLSPPLDTCDRPLSFFLSLFDVTAAASSPYKRLLLLSDGAWRPWRILCFSSFTHLPSLDTTRRRHLALQTVVRVPGADCGLLRLSFANSTRLDSFHSFTFDSLIHSRLRRRLLFPFLSVCLLIPKRSSLIFFGLQQQQQQSPPILSCLVCISSSS